MRRTISAVLALAMVAALIAAIAGAATAQVTEPSGQIAVVNGANTDAVTATAGGQAVGGSLEYGADAQSAILAAGQYDVLFSDGRQATAVALAEVSALTVVSGYSEDGSGAAAYPVDMAPIDEGMAKVRIWNATEAPVNLTIAPEAAVPLAPGAGTEPRMVPADTVLTIDIDGVVTEITAVADSYTDVFAINDGTTPEIAVALIPSMTELIAALTPEEPPAGIAVPDVVGQARADAEAAITGAGLVAATSEAPNDTIEAGIVVSQDPAAGTEVEDGSTVSIIVSTGPEEPATVPVPDVTGKPVADAQAELEAAGFVVATEEQSSTEVEAGLVMGTNPAAGTEVAPGTEVRMTVSSGPGDVVVPDLIGMTADDATAAGESAGLMVTIVEDPDNPDPEGKVVTQDPAPGTKVEAGSEVVAQLSPDLDDPWVILTMDPKRLMTVSGINFLPGSTVQLSVVDTDKTAASAAGDDGSWAARFDLSDVDNDEALLLVEGTAADTSSYVGTFKIPAAGEDTAEPVEETEPVEEEGGQFWPWILLLAVVVAATAIIFVMFGNRGAEGEGDGPESPNDGES